MSTLTKILIVLLTISSIFLCGIVVTYVGSAENYKELYTKQRTDISSLREREKAATEERNNTIEQAQKRDIELNNTIKSLQAEINRLKSDLAKAEMERDDKIRKVESWASLTTDLKETNEKWRQMLDTALADVKKLNTLQDQNYKELQEKALSLLEKMSLIDQLEKETRRLREENTTLHGKLDQFLREYGKTTSIPAPVTQLEDKAQVAPPPADIGLKGMINEVNLENSWAEISIGSANGVKEKMIFHATRGDQFICDIVIFEVDPDKAIGMLELVQETPKAGDIVSTNL